MDFFKEFEKLQAKIPRIGSIRLKPVNSEYTHNTDQCKNCYLIANAVKNQDCMYGRDFYSNEDCIDCDHILRCTLCYECLNSKECYNASFLQDCANCIDCQYGYFLKDCKNCIGCVGLNKKEFHIFNEQYSREDFFKKKARLGQEKIQSRFDELKLKVPRVFALQIGSENSTGDNVLNSKNAYSCFDIVECEDVGYLAECKKVKDSFDIFVLEDSELCYECSSNHILYNCNFCFMCVSSSNLEYCDLVFNSKYCFGCVSLNHKEYYILNKVYSKEDYFKKISEIKDQLKNEGTYGKWFFHSTYPLQDKVALWERL